MCMHMDVCTYLQLTAHKAVIKELVLYQMFARAMLAGMELLATQVIFNQSVYHVMPHECMASIIVYPTTTMLL